MSTIIKDGNFGPFSHYKKIVECNDGDIYTVSGITRPEYIYGLTPGIKYEIMIFDKSNNSIYTDIFHEDDYNEFMDKCNDIANNLEVYLKKG